MTYISSASFDTQDKNLLCHYQNQTQQIVIARIANVPNYYFEKVVFPFERLLLEVPQQAKLEIYSYTNVGTMKDIIPCCELKINQEKPLAYASV